MKTNEIKSSKLPFERMVIGMKFYKFSENDPDEYSIYYIIKTFVTKEKQIIRIKNYETNEVINLNYDEYLNTNNYILIGNYTRWYYSFYKRAYDPFIQFISFIDDDINDVGFTQRIPYPTFSKSEISYDDNVIPPWPIAIYPISKINILNDIAKNFINEIIDIHPDYIKMNNEIRITPIQKEGARRFDEILKKSYKFIAKDLWVSNTMSVPKNLPDNFVLVQGSITLKEYTVDYPDNILPEEYMNEIVSNSNISKKISAYELFEYDESIDLSNIKFDHLIIYCMKDDAYYVMLYKTDNTPLYELNYEHDEEIKEVVDFMFRKK